MKKSKYSYTERRKIHIQPPTEIIFNSRFIVINIIPYKWYKNLRTIIGDHLFRV